MLFALSYYIIQHWSQFEKFVIPSVILTFSQMKVIENLKESVPVHYESEPRMRKYGVYKQQLFTSEWYIIPIAISKVKNSTICYGATSSTPVAKQRYESLDGGRRGYTLWRATRMGWFPKMQWIRGDCGLPWNKSNFVAIQLPNRRVN